MGIIGRVVKFLRTSVEGANVSDVELKTREVYRATAQHMPPTGEDAQPLETDYAFAVPDENTGRLICVAYLDPKSEQLAEAGERRTYSRNAGGERVAHVWLKNDGQILVEGNATVTVQNPGGSFTLTEGGELTVNASASMKFEAPTIDLNGSIFTPGGVASMQSATINGIVQETHTHSQDPDSAGDTQQNTNGPQ